MKQFFRELLCKHEIDYTGEYISESFYDGDNNQYKGSNIKISIIGNKKFCLKCGKII